jgi:type I restriction enzyme S subunit
MENSENKTPSIRFPEFKETWKHKKLSELLSESKKRNVDLKFSKDEVLSVSGELGIVNQIEHLGRSYAGVSVHNYHVVETNDIVYTKSPLKANPYGIIRLNKGKAGIVSTLYAVYKVKTENAFGAFLDYYFSLDANTNRYLRPLVKKGAKNDMKINNSYVLTENIFVPQITEQKKIAFFLIAVDKKIQQLTQKKALLQQYKKGMMWQIFNQEIQFKDDKGNVFADWEERNIGQVIALRKEKYNPETSSVSHKCIELEHLDQKTGILLGYTESLGQKSIKNVFQKGDILFGKLRPYLKKYWKAEFNGVCSSEIWVIKPKSNEYLKDYLFYLIQSDTFLGAANISSGSKMPRADWNFVINYPILISNSIPEQKKIANFLSAIDYKISLVNQQLEKTQIYKKGLLQQMFI